MVRIVNPYSFVPLGAGPKRCEPHYHHRQGAVCFSGLVEYTITTEAPLLLGPGDQGGPPRDTDGRLVIPGSTIAGSVRAIHEALTDSCLRVVDTDYVPVHRHVLDNEDAGKLELAVVKDVDEATGLPTSVQLTKQRVLIDSSLFLPYGKARIGDANTPGGDPWCSGARFNLPAYPRTVARRGSIPLLDQGQFVRSPSQRADGGWVLLISDTAARRPDKPTWWSAGELPDPGADSLEVSESVRRALARDLEGAQDLHGDHQPDTGQSHVNVYRPGDLDSFRRGHAPVDEPVDVIGRRYAVRPDMFTPGFPLWVEVAGTGGSRRVEGVRLSQLWRYAQDGLMQDRLGEYAPCDGTAPHAQGPVPKGHAGPGARLSLCPSCRLFGSAGDEDSEASRSHAYAGHLRFRDAVARDELQPDGRKVQTDRPREVPQLFSPRPTTAQFYLESATWQGKTEGKRPYSYWDSPADTTTPRPIRGRKFYWGSTGDHASVEATDPPRQSVILIPKGAVFKGRVTFDNIDEEQLATLFVALSPQLALTGARGRLGGGRPFGWGVVRIDLGDYTRIDYSLTPCRPEAVAAPTPIDPPLIDPGDLGASKVQLEALHHLLTPDFVPADKVRYPRGGETNSFWKTSRGFREAGRSYPLAVLPGAQDDPTKQFIADPGVV